MAGEVSLSVVDEISARVGGRVGGESSFAYVEELLAVANEAGVTMGESTCWAKLTAVPANHAEDTKQGFKGALVDVTALSRFGLARCSTARCAVSLMGELGEAFGYYSAGAAKDEGGEVLTVSDGREVWMFHILPANATDTSLPSGKRASAIWAAMRLGVGEVAVCANAFILRGVPDASGLGLDGREYLVSPNVRSAAAEHGLPLHLTKGGEVDFFACYGGGSDPFNLKRQWRIFDRLAPSLRLPADDVLIVKLREQARAEGVGCDGPTDVECTGTTDEYPAGVFADFPADYRDTINAYYPVAVAIESAALPTNPAEQVETAALMVDLMREIYTGTQFDASLSVMGGPYGNPEEMPGSPRRISLQRSQFWHVSQSSSLEPAGGGDDETAWLDRVPIVRYGQYAPHSTVAVPVFVSGDSDVPAPLSTGSHFVADALVSLGTDQTVAVDAVGAPAAIGGGSMFWAATMVGGWAHAYFRIAQPVVASWQRGLEEELGAIVLDALASARDQLADGRSRAAVEDEVLAAANEDSASLSLGRWQALFVHLATTFRDGYMFGPRCGHSLGDEGALAAWPSSGVVADTPGVTAGKCDACPPANPTSSYGEWVGSSRHCRAARRPARANQPTAVRSHPPSHRPLVLPPKQTCR